MSENNQMMSVQGQLVGMPLAGPESFSAQQLDYLKRALGVDETVLYDGESSPMTYGGSATVSESLTKFDRIRVYYGGENPSTRNHRNVAEIQVTGSDTLIALGSVFSRYNDGKYNFALLNLSYNDSTLSVCLQACARYNMNAATPIDWGANTTSFSCIYKIVGIHRIAGGNT